MVGLVLQKNFMTPLPSSPCSQCSTCSIPAVAAAAIAAVVVSRTVAISLAIACDSTTTQIKSADIQLGEHAQKRS